MAHHNDLGKRGEQLAREYLTVQHFTILHTNWKWSRYEIDVIASRGKMLHFIEVKTRSNGRFGFPEESVDRGKMLRLMKAAEQYQYLHPAWKWVQYDILSIMMRQGQEPEYFLLEDVYL